MGDLAARYFPHSTECPIGSELPEQLRGLGYEVLAVGTGERLLPMTEVLTEH